VLIVSILKTRNLKRKFPNKVFQLFISAIILCITFSECALISTKKIKHETFNISDFRDHEKTAKGLKYLSESGHLIIDTDEINLKLSMKLQFKTIDSMYIQLTDPIGRKFAEVSLDGDEYSIWLQRSGEFYSGYELPIEFKDYPFAALTFGELRRILLGIPLFKTRQIEEIQDNHTIEFLSQRGEKVQYVFAGNPLYLNEILLLSDTGNIKAKMKYEKYAVVNGIFIPSVYTIEGSEKNFLIKIRISHFSTELSKLMM